MVKKNGLEQAMIALIQSQAIMSERFARIENDLAEIKTILFEHQQILKNLPEAVRQKIGFEPRQ